MAETMTADEPWTVRRVLDWTINYLKESGSENPRLDAEILLAHSRNCPRIQLYTQFDEPLSDSERTQMRSLVQRRATAEPVAYLVGYREFFSLEFEISRDVFIPRPDTETLVAAALDILKPIPSPQLLELCTGSGCIPISIAKNHPAVQITTVEKNPAPFDVATRNIEKHELSQRINLIQGDLFGPIEAKSQFQMIVSNPPYVLKAEIETLDADVRDHEPHCALDGGDDGLDVVRLLVNESPDYLSNGGWLLFELDPAQAETAYDLMQARGFTELRTEDDLSGQPRVVLGCWRSRI